MKKIVLNGQIGQKQYNLLLQLILVSLKPVVVILLSIVFTMELARVSTKIDGDRTLGVKMVAASMFKMALILLWFYHKICIFCLSDDNWFLPYKTNFLQIKSAKYKI